MVSTTRRLDAFNVGQGVEPPTYCCAECGYESLKRRNFRKTEDGESRTCNTGHFEDSEGNLKRARNPYARR